MSRQRRESHGGILSPHMAMYHAVHNGYTGGLPVIAALMNSGSPDTLRKKLDPEQTSHHLRFDEAIDILRITKDTRILDAICAQVGAVWHYPADVADTPADLDVLSTGTELMDRSVRLLTELESALRDGDIDSDEGARINERMMRLQQSIQNIAETAERFKREDV